MIDPVNMTVIQWSDAVVLSIRDAWAIGRLDDELKWQDWGIGLVRAFSAKSPPNPYEFDDWRDWAQRIYPMLETVTDV